MLAFFDEISSFYCDRVNGLTEYYVLQLIIQTEKFFDTTH
jgi:hypothetical protein